MALPMIETGYKPEFGLGAVYQGFNAGNADMSAQEELIKQFLANQREQQMQPLDVNVRQYDSDLANAKRNDPNFIPWQLAGQSGQMMSQDAAGRSAQSLFGDKLAADRQKLQNDLVTGQSANIFSKEQLQMLQDLKSGNTPYAGTGQVGFPMQPQEQEPQGRIASQWGGEGLSVPVPRGDYSKENNLRGLMGTDYRSGTKDYDFETIDKEIARTKDAKILAILQEERKRMEAEFGGAPQKGTVFSSMQKTSGSGETPWGDLMPRNSILGRMAGTMAMTPDTVAKLAGGEQKAQSAVEVAQIKAEADAAKANAKLTEPKYKEQLAQAFKVLADPQATPQARYEAEMFVHLDKQTRLAANPGAYQQRFDLGSQGLPMTPAPVNQQKAPVAPGSQPVSNKEALKKQLQ